MAATRTIQISALNIAMHRPHSPARYLDLFREAKRQNRLFRIGELYGVMLGPIGAPEDYEKGVEVTGEIYRFVKIDPSQPWFNVVTAKAATEDDMDHVQLPDNLLPHLRRIKFLFRPDQHLLWFVSADRKDKLAPAVAARFFQSLFDSFAQERGFPQVEVTVLPEHDTVNELFSNRLDRIKIVLKRPNADDGADDEERFMKRLDRQNIRKIRTEMFSSDRDGIVPDDETRAMAEVAAKNGEVEIVGRDATGKRIRESTIDRPMVRNEPVNQFVETAAEVLSRVADEHRR